MTLLRRLAIRAARELARRPEVRAKAKETLTNATRVFNEEVKPRSKDAGTHSQTSSTPRPDSSGLPRSCETSTVRDATANRRYPAGAAGLEARLKRFTQKLRDKYRKGRDGK